MDVAAIIVLFVTVLVGLIVLGLWAEPARTNSDRRSVVLATVHIIGALLAVTLWLVFAVGQADVVGRIGLIVLIATVALGASTLLSSRTFERAAPVDASPRPVSPRLLVAHGALAGSALVLAVAAVATR